MRVQNGPQLRIAAVDVLAIRQALHHHRTSFQAALQLIERIGSRRVDGDCWKKLAMLAREPQHVIIWHIHRAGIHLPPAHLVDFLVRENYRRLQGRAADQFQQPCDVSRIELLRGEARRHTDVAQHERRQRPMRGADLQPPTTPTAAIGDDVHVHVERCIGREDIVAIHCLTMWRRARRGN
jgi:hypothetical protein